MRTREIAVGGQPRSYHLHTPPGPARPLPILVALHGKGDTGRDFLAGTGLGRAEALVAAPTGAGLAWSPAPYAHTTLGEDAALVRTIIDATSGPSSTPPRSTSPAFPTAAGSR